MAAFDPTRCGSDSIDPIGPVDLVPDCTVPEGPERLRECPEAVLQTPAPKIKGRKGRKGPKGNRGPKGPTGPAGDNGRDGCTPAFLPPIVTYHLVPAAGNAEAIVTLAQSDCQFQFTVDLGFPVGGGAFEFCNLWMWCAGGWVPYVLNDVEHIDEPPISGEYDGQSKWVCDCDLSSLSY